MSALKMNSGLGPRLIVGVLMAVIAISVIWYGGLPFTLMMAAGIALIYWEWCAMHQIGPGWRTAGAVVLAIVSGLTHLGHISVALSILGTGALVMLVGGITANMAQKRWLVLGLIYAALPGMALIWLRLLPDGFQLVMWTMGLVWATDILAYFAGRSIGGPKIWTAISPNKTWAGLAGGMVGAGVFSAAFASWQGWDVALPLMLVLGAGLAVLAQAGDFFESWLKRCNDVKDSGSIFPGHGGIMDRVDGLVPVACVVSVFVAIYHYKAMSLIGFGSFA